jgi:EAL and modified HD-GYP domain-containing signal transduction protein
MKNWFLRLFDRKDSSAPAPSPAVPALPLRMSGSSEQAAPVPGVRRPLVATNGDVAGFEFTLAASIEDRLRRRADPVAHAAHAISLLLAMRPAVEAEQIALASLPAELLMRPEVIAHLPAGAWLCLIPAAESATASDEDRASLLAALRGCGVRVGTQGSPSQAPAGGVKFDFTVMAMDAGGIEPLIATIGALRSARATDAIIATGLPDVDAIERALAAGATLASGSFNAQVAAPKQRTLNGDVLRIIGLLNAVRDERQPLRDLTRDLRGDVGLCYRLLRHVNSPAMGLTRSVESIDQAVLILGRSELYRWLSVLLLAAVSGRPSSRALQEISLARARMLELLARECGTEPPDALFTVGMLSLLNVMLEMPMSQALQPLRLSETAHNALLDRSGPWHAMLTLSEALERHDLDVVDSVAAQFGGTERVMELSDSAWRWAMAVHRNA